MNKQLLKSIIFICAYTSIGIGINYNGEYNYSKKTLDEYRKYKKNNDMSNISYEITQLKDENEAISYGIKKYNNEHLCTLFWPLEMYSTIYSSIVLLLNKEK